MTTTSVPTPSVSRFSAAGAFLEGLAAQDFGRLASALHDDAHLRALLPIGFVELDGAGAIKAAFTKWFGDTERFELVDAVAGDVGARLHLQWRVRIQATRLGEGWFVVEQKAYADTDGANRIKQLSLLCTGYCPEGAHA